MQRLVYILVFTAIASGAMAQMGLDPEFSYFYRHSLNVNPALAGQSDTKWELQTTAREQYYVISQPYRSGVSSLDINLPINAWSGNRSQSAGSLGQKNLQNSLRFTAD